ncbi:MAG: phenylalanine--tRNA ligase subunit beta [Bacteroidetes bacterium]|nr:phenylalanine--tRNA ligase subunit beta [Bacteroidota bacterium]
MKTISVKINNPELCPRYTARVIENVKMQSSPMWLQNTLNNIGLRPKNIVVDVTNYVLMDIGQPLHAFDYDTIEKHKIEVKNGFNQKFITLDDKERQLTEDMLMICDAEKPIAIAGVMGGKNSEITDNSANIVIESAYFNASSIRKTSKTLGVVSDASYRFERGTDVDICMYALDLATEMIMELAGGKVYNDIIDIYPSPIIPKAIEFRFEKARQIIGADIPNAIMTSIFKYLGFDTKTSVKSKSIIVTIPNRRVDIFAEIDLIEEVARIINYDNITPNYASIVNFKDDDLPSYLKPLPLRNKIRNYLVHNGYTELLTQNIIDPASAALTHNKYICIENPLGSEMSVMRPSMLPSVLKAVSHNLRQGNHNLKLFETSKVFLPQNNISNSFIEGIDEREQLVIAFTGNTNPRQWGIPDKSIDFFDVKGNIAELLDFMRIPKRKTNPITINTEHLNIFDANSTEIFTNKTSIGFMGQIKKNVLEKYEIDAPLYVAMLDLTTISEVPIPTSNYAPVSQYPAIKRDLVFIVSENITSKEIRKTIIDKGSNILKSVCVFDIYRGKNIEKDKYSIGFELTFNSNEKTLTDTEVENDITKIIQSVEKNFNAELRR